MIAFRKHQRYLMHFRPRTGLLSDDVLPEILYIGCKHNDKLLQFVEQDFET